MKLEVSNQKILLPSDVDRIFSKYNDGLKQSFIYEINTADKSDIFELNCNGQIIGIALVSGNFVRFRIDMDYTSFEIYEYFINNLLRQHKFSGNITVETEGNFIIHKYMEMLGFTFKIASFLMSYNNGRLPTPQDFEIRNYCDGDYSEWQKADAEAFYEENVRYDIKPYMRMPDENWRKELAQNANNTFVCISNGEIAATCAFDKNTHLIGETFTKTKYKLKGFGKAILAHTINKAYDAGIKRLYLGVVSDNEAAKGLYRSVGFRYESTMSYFVKEI